MCKWWNGTHVKNELIHQNTMLKFYGQIFGIQFVMDFKSCTKTHVESRINSMDSIRQFEKIWWLNSEMYIKYETSEGSLSYVENNDLDP
jgi:hypothetical protein